jgi:hypothetical protein
MIKSLALKLIIWLLIAVVQTGYATRPHPSDLAHLFQNPAGDSLSLQTFIKKQTGTLWYGIYLEGVKIDDFRSSLYDDQ